MTIKIPFKIVNIEDDGCHALVRVQFNKSKSGDLILDTGASKSVFDIGLLSPLVEMVESEQGKIKSSGISEGFIQNKLAILPEIRVGELVIENSTIVLLNLTHINTLFSRFSKKKIWGLLGGDFFKKYKAVINYKKLTMTLDITGKLK